MREEEHEMSVQLKTDWPRATCLTRLEIDASYLSSFPHHTPNRCPPSSVDSLVASTSRAIQNRLLDFELSRIFRECRLNDSFLSKNSTISVFLAATVHELPLLWTNTQDSSIFRVLWIC